MPGSSGLIARETLLATCGSDEHVLEQIVRGLFVHVPRDLEALRVAMQSDDLHRVRDAAHKLYGMVSAVSIVVGEVALELEEQANRGDPASAASTFVRLTDGLDALLGELPGVTVLSLEAGLWPP